jgi:hypothetical protein
VPAGGARRGISDSIRRHRSVPDVDLHELARRQADDLDQLLSFPYLGSNHIVAKLEAEVIGSDDAGCR